MNNTDYIAASHETYDLHELLTFKNLCLTKSTTMRKLVQDAEFGRILIKVYLNQKTKFSVSRNLSQTEVMNPEWNDP
ncbi:hypothetical protein AB1K84_05350 [Mesobacillus foraminis]|uniref:hypothetical protein n=1 Tax=Mesobacillus foraminis TaxID=279826 RepID=UPI00399F127C